MFHLASSKIMSVYAYCDLIDAVWDKNFDSLIKKRDKNEFAQHIFVSQMCDVPAVDEYATVCKLLGVKIINLVGNKVFYEKSKKLLSKIPNVKIYWMNR